MNSTEIADRIWRGGSLGSRLARAALTPLSRLFGLLVHLRLYMYAKGYSRVGGVRTPVVSIGNLTVGGTGKTPLVIWLVEGLCRRGKRPVVVSRGYGTRGRRPTVVFPATASSPRLSAPAGDEAVLVSRRAGCPVITAASKLAACRMAEKHFDPDTIILDDGFQHLGLRRQLDVVVLGGEEISGDLLPAGPLREPLSALVRADVVITAETGTPLAEGSLPGSPTVLRMRRDPTGLVEDTAMDATRLPMSEIAGRRVVTVAGIARPEDFVETVRKAGAEIVGSLIYPDHHGYTRADWKRIRSLAQDADCVVTTEKDLVKLGRFGAESGFLLAVRLGVEIEQGEAFVDLVAGLRKAPRRSLVRQPPGGSAALGEAAGPR